MSESFAQILREVATRHGLTVEDLKGRDRTPRVAIPRCEAMREGLSRTNLSSVNIGKRLGGRDHSTVLKIVKAYARRASEARG